MLFFPSSLPPVSIEVINVHLVQKVSFHKIPDSPGCSLPSSIASIIRIPSTGGSKDLSYFELTCTEADKKNIGFIIRTMAENGKISLLFKQGELKRIGEEINHVHPLRFLGTIFSDPHLKQCMREIYTDYFKWNGFMDGLGPSLTNQASQGKLMQYLNDFAKECDVAPESISGYISSKSWEDMVRYLMNH